MASAVLKIQAIAQGDLDRLIDRQVDLRQARSEKTRIWVWVTETSEKRAAKFLADQVCGELWSPPWEVVEFELGKERRHIVLIVVDVVVGLGQASASSFTGEERFPVRRSLCCGRLRALSNPCFSVASSFFFHRCDSASDLVVDRLQLVVHFLEQSGYARPELGPGSTSFCTSSQKERIGAGAHARPAARR